MSNILNGEDDGERRLSRFEQFLRDLKQRTSRKGLLFIGSIDEYVRMLAVGAHVNSCGCAHCTAKKQEVMETILSSFQIDTTNTDRQDDLQRHIGAAFNWRNN